MNLWLNPAHWPFGGRGSAPKLVGCGFDPWPKSVKMEPLLGTQDLGLVVGDHQRIGSFTMIRGTF